MKLLRGDVLSKKLSRNARNLVEREYDWNNIAKNLKEIYKTVMKTN